MHQRTRSIVLTAGLAGLLGTAGTALGQHALGDGRALDRNMQKGSGGYNTKVRDLDAQIKLNEAIVTGNAGFGRSFRGNAGYLATDDFRAGLGSNDLFKERREMAGSALLGGAATGGSGMFNSVDASEPGSVRFTQRGIRGTDALRYQMALTTGNTSPDDAGVIPLTVRRAGAGASGQVVGDAMRSTSEFRTQRSSQPTILGTEVGPDGQPYALLASPLLGVKVRAVDTDTGTPPNPDEPGRWRPSGVESQARMARERLTGDNPTPPPPTQVNTKINTETGAVESVLDRFKTATDNRANGPLDTRDRPLDTKPGDRSIPTNPASAPNSNPNPSNPKAPGDKSIPGARPDDKPGDTGAPRPAWLVNLEDMRRALRGEEPSKPDKKPGADNDANKPDGTKPDPTKPRSPTASMTPEQRRIDLDARIKAVLDAQGFDHDKDAFSVEQVDAAKRARVKVRSMAANSQASVDYIERMVDGERAMHEERYFDAEDAFSRALGTSTGDALAQAGRVHAQIGAGLYMSAAANLRDLFAAHPEMIGVKYEANVMPPTERIKTIREQLAKAAANTQTALSGDAGLLQAYVAYQLGDLPGVDAGLKTFGSKIQPGDNASLALLELAAKIWKSPVPTDLPVLEKAPARVPAPAPAGAPKPAGDINK
jgi:hypothetical protein